MARLFRDAGAPSPAADETWRMLVGLIEASRIVPERVRAAPGSLPLTVIGGFLGAGKTTLLNRLLTGTHGLRLAVLVNDFGRINIDAELVRSRTEDTISLANGCACCSVAGDLTRTLLDLSEREQPPEAIVLEASGVADPRSLAQVALANPALRLDGLVTVVDAETVPALSVHADYAALFASQVAAADLVVLSKTDLVPGEAVAEAQRWIAAQAPGCPIVAAIQGDVPAGVLLGIAADRPAGGGPGPDDHGRLFRSASLACDEPLDEAAFLKWAGSFDDSLVRAKGILWLAGEERRVVYQRVGRRWGLTRGEPWGEAPRGSRLVLIGPASAPLDADLAGCRARVPG